MAAYIPSCAADRFFRWFCGYDPTEKKVDPGWTITSYMMYWLEHGDGIEAVGGQYTIFLKAVAIVCQECHRDPSQLDLHYREDGAEKTLQRRPKYVVYSETGTDADETWCDEDLFNFIVFEYQHGLGPRRR